MRDKGRTGRWDRQSESKVRDACDQGVMRLVTCHSDQARHQTGCTVQSPVSHQDDCRWRLCRLCSVPRPGCRLHQSSGLLQPADTGDQWELRSGERLANGGRGNVKVGITSLSAQCTQCCRYRQRRGNLQRCAAWPSTAAESCLQRLRVNNWSSPASVPGIGQVIGLGIGHCPRPFHWPFYVPLLSRRNLCSEGSTLNTSPMTSTRRSELVRSDPQIRSFGILSPGGKTFQMWKNYSINTMLQSTKERVREKIISVSTKDWGSRLYSWS